MTDAQFKRAVVETTLQCNTRQRLLDATLAKVTMAR